MEGHTLLSSSTMQGILGAFFKKWRAWKSHSPCIPLPLLVWPAPGGLSSWASKHLETMWSGNIPGAPTGTFQSLSVQEYSRSREEGEEALDSQPWRPCGRAAGPMPLTHTISHSSAGSWSKCCTGLADQEHSCASKLTLKQWGASDKTGGQKPRKVQHTSETSANMHTLQRMPRADRDQKHVAATCIFPRTVLLSGKRNSGCSLELVWPGRGWQSYLSLDILK